MKSINTSKTKHALLYMIPVIQVLDCKKKWSWRHICWNADPSWAWKQLMKYEMHWFRLKHNITLLFWLRPQTSRHSSCEILKFNVSQQTLHYWSQKLLLRCPSSSIGFWWCFSYYVYFNEKLILDMMLILSTGWDHIRWWQTSSSSWNLPYYIKC